MRLWASVSLLLIGLLASTLSFAQASQSNPASGFSPISIDGSEKMLLITASMQVLEDSDSKLTFDEVRTRDDWRSGPSDAFVFGFSRSTWWVRAAIRNTTNTSFRSVLDLGNSRQDYLSWYIVRDNGRVIEAGLSGDRLPFAQRPLPERNLVLPLVLSAREEVQIYIRMESFDGLFESMPLRISSMHGFVEAKAREGLLFALYIGGLLTLGLYNLLLYISTRERGFGIYVAYLSCFTLWNFTFHGYGNQHLWPSATELNHILLTVTSSWSFACFGYFAMVYLRMRHTVPRWVYRAHIALIAANALVAVPAFAGFYAIGVAAGHIAGLLLTALTMPTAIWLLTRGLRQARFFVIAFALLCTGVTLYILQIIGVVPTNWITTWGLQIGSAVEVLLLAFGLADALNTLKAEKFRAEKRALIVQQELNAKLEQQVSDRTKALEVANRRLHELTITDELTGAFNRRHFNAICAATLANRAQGESLAFCMFDIDFFKGFNDRYGHQAGDTALRSVARAVQTELQRSGDILFRLGGEEFGVIYAADSPEASLAFANRLRQAIRELAIPHLDSPFEVVTASFGVGWWGSAVLYRLTAEQIYAAADSALYAAKEGGRDRVETEAHFATGMHRALTQIPDLKPVESA